MRHGFIRPPLHFSPVPFAPYYSHLTASWRGRVCLRPCVPATARAMCAFAQRTHTHASLCILRYHVFRMGTRARTLERRGESSGKEREGEREATYVRCSHYTSCRFHLHLIVCLTAGGGRERRTKKKKTDLFESQRGS